MENNLPMQFFLIDNEEKIERFLFVFNFIEVKKISGGVLEQIISDKEYVDRPILINQGNDFQLLFNKNCLERNRDYYFIEDICRKWVEYELAKIVGDRDLVIWGCGKNGKNFIKEIKNLKIDAAIDSDVDITASGKWNGIPCYPADNIDKKLLDGKFVLITSNFYQEICDCLKEKGQKEFEDFMSFRAFDLSLTDRICDSILGTPKMKHCCPVSEYSTAFRFGLLYMCPYAGWSDSIGNVHYMRADDIYDSILKRAFEVSIKYRTASFCNKQSCDFIFNEPLYTDVDYKKWELLTESGIKVGVAGYDDSCNLYCASCRDHVMGGTSERKQRDHDYFVKHILPDSDVIKLATMGDPFASKYYGELIDRICEYGDKSVVLISNGVLATKEKVEKIGVNTRGLAVNFSVDAATEKTYLKLRRGGNFKKVMKNIKDIGNLRKCNDVAWFSLVFVVQAENYMEMEQFIHFAEDNNVDAIDFIKLDNWGTFTDQEFEKYALVHADRTPVDELQIELDKCFSLSSSVKLYFDSDSKFMQEVISKTISL